MNARLEARDRPAVATAATSIDPLVASAGSADSRPPIGQKGQPLHVADLVPALLADGLLTADDARQVSQYARLSTAGAHALVSLAQRKLKTSDGKQLDLDLLGRWLAGRVGLPYVHVDPLKVEFSRIAEVMSSQYASRFKILPLEVRGNEVVIATAEPFMTPWVDELRHTLRKEIRQVITNPLDISRYIVEFFSLAKSVKGASKSSGSNSVQSNFEQLVELGKAGKSFDANDQHIISIVDWLWQYAFDQRASDIHMEPRRDLGVVRFRIDGVLHNVYQVPPSVMNAMTSRVKLLGRMDVVEKRRPQDGRIKTRTAEGKEIELRLATLPTAFGEKLVMRIFDPDVLLRDFAELGFGGEELETWNDLTTRPNGIVLVTGPTGSGKTTTLYTTLKQLA